MSLRLSTLLLFTLIAVSCNKKTLEKLTTTSNTLLGKWRYTEYYISTGGPSQWQPVKPEGQMVDFRADGSFQSVTSFSPSFQHYEIMDSSKVKFTPAPSPTGFVLMEFDLDAEEGTLVLTPINPMCIEGCSYKFKRRSF